ncbi:PH, RCC1 and FYVE domains-containing protein 1 [Linum perenne]
MFPTDRVAAPAEQSRAGPMERDVELAITALKKGSQLLKYGRRGKPKFCPFRLANDESALIWLADKEEKHLKLSHVSRIVPGQRTPIFQRYPRPEKEYQSFSLIYHDRSLDLICKDKDEAEVWITGLKALIQRIKKRRDESRSDGIMSGATSPKGQTQRSSPLSSAFDSADSSQKDGVDPFRLCIPYDSPSKVGLEKELSEVMSYPLPPRAFFLPESSSGSVHSLSSGGSDGIVGRIKGMNVDTFRMSLSSAVSSSSQGSGHDDSDALGDVYMWGEGTGDGILGGGVHRVGDSGLAMDSFVPKPLDSAVILDVQAIACGRRHAALVTKQGEVFTWGEELGGRLGHGIDSNVLHPKLLDGLKNINIELVACGEYHSCAVSLSGDLYLWGNSASSLKVNGYGTEVSQWAPRKLNGPLEGIPVSSVSCGPWHTAVVTSAGQLFTFGDGTFGVLGHGDRKSISVPREVESLKGLRTMRAACGVWHTAAVVEVMVGSSSTNNCCSGKLFTWGDGDKGRLGHGNMEAKLVPTCVAALGESNFCQVACGHSMTVALTTTGHVYTMGSPVYGQLGSPQASVKAPTRVGGKLINNFVEELACGAFHVAVLTSKTEVYTWGKGANGRLGHGDTDDRNSPTLVEALKDKQVKSIVCGTSLTAAICLHKSVSGVDQSMCSGCRLPFNFKRKRHNCYNCGLVFCHSCSSRKSLKAAMAPNPNKTYRVCDHCYGKLRKATETESSSQSTQIRGIVGQGGNEAVERSETMASKPHMQLGRKFSLESSIDVESGFTKRNKKLSSTSTQVSPTGNGFKHNPFQNSKSFGSSKKFFSASLPGSRIMSRATSPTSRRSSPPRATTPSPVIATHALPSVGVDEAKKINEGLSGEVAKLRAQVEELTRKTRVQEDEMQRVTGQLKEAIALAEEESGKCKAAKEVIKSLTAQLKDVAERLPVGAARSITPISCHNSSSISPRETCSEAYGQQLSCVTGRQEEDSNGVSSIVISQGSGTSTSRRSNLCELVNGETTGRSKNRMSKIEPCQKDEWVEQDEPGVYITLVLLPGGTKDLKRVRFSRKRFSEKQAEQWWAANRGRVYEQYNVPMEEKPSAAAAGLSIIGKEGC